MTATFGELEPLAAALDAHRVILDGELVCLDADGKPDFHRLRPRITGNPGARATYIAFDVLHLDGCAVRQLPYRERRSILHELLAASGPGWIVPRPLVGEPEQILALLAQERLEGVVAKHLQRPYRPGRHSGDWVKRKIRRAETFTVTAYKPAQPGEPDTIFVSAAQPAGSCAPPAPCNSASTPTSALPCARRSSSA
jgi:bifunctional non-homologous end joining protein LigD